MSFQILGIGTAQAPFALEQSFAAELSKAYCCANEQQERAFVAIYRRSRVRKRGSIVLENSAGLDTRQSFFAPARDADDRGPTTGARVAEFSQRAGPLAAAAARDALRDAHADPAEITHVVTASCTGFYAPGFDIRMMKDLGLSPLAQRTHIGFMGCHAALNAMRVASAYAGADPHARVLVCAAELCSLHFQYGWDPDRVVANALFADGAAAMVVAPPGAAQNGAPSWRLAASGSMLFPDSEDEMTWRIGDHGFVMTLSARVPGLLGEHLRPWVEAWLASHGLSIEAVRSWAIHPGGPRIVSSVVAALELPADVAEDSNEVLAEHGNMSSPTIVFILKRMRARNAPRPCVALAFGPGLVAEAALFV